MAPLPASPVKSMCHAGTCVALQTRAWNTLCLKSARDITHRSSAICACARLQRGWQLRQPLLTRLLRWAVAAAQQPQLTLTLVAVAAAAGQLLP